MNRLSKAFAFMVAAAVMSTGCSQLHAYSNLIDMIDGASLCLEHLVDQSCALK